jgi:hypothetical protein
MLHRLIDAVLGMVARASRLDLDAGRAKEMDFGCEEARRVPRDPIHLVVIEGGRKENPGDVRTSPQAPRRNVG